MEGLRRQGQLLHTVLFLATLLEVHFEFLASNHY